MIRDLVLLRQGSDRPHNVLGIDLGTTNSTATWLHWTGSADDEPVESLVEIEQQTDKGPMRSHLVPSAVHVRQDGEVWVGEGARLMLSKVGRRGVIPNQTIFCETKNDIGTALRYPMAPPGFQTPQEIATQILRFIHHESKSHLPEGVAFDRVVVTVPASFSLQQREQTMAAAREAGIDLEPSDLLDEPVAALIFGLSNLPEALSLVRKAATRALLFDFGGGTCDVALVELEMDEGTLLAATAGVSRYTRLGGGDVDRAIVANVLLPRLLEANSIDPASLSWSQKAAVLTPQLLPIAEELKIKLSTEVARRRSRGLPEGTVTAGTSARAQVSVHKRTLELAPDKTEITSEEFRAACAEFFAPTAVLPRHTEYYEAASPLQPIRQALNGAEWDAEEVDLVLTAGGSSKLPEVVSLLSGFFRCPIYAVTGPEEYESQTEISRGAAVHALRLSLTDTAVVQPRATEDLHLRTEGSTERLPLLLRGEALPYVGSPITHLRVGDDRELRLELLRGERALFTEFFALPGHVQPADRMTVLYDVDAGRLLSLHVSFPSCRPECSDEHRISLQLQSSWSYVHDDKSPGARAIEIEQVLKSGTANADEAVDLRFDLISQYRELKFRERAAEQATRLSTMESRPDIRGRAVNLLGILAHEAGDLGAAAHYYRQAADIGNVYALANLALAQRAQGNFEDALIAIDEALDLREDPDFRMKRAQILERLGRAGEADESRRTVLDELGPLHAAADRALEAAAQAAHEVGDLRLEGRIQDELTSRGQRRSGTRGSLPVIAE